MTRSMIRICEDDTLFNPAHVVAISNVFTSVTEDRNRDQCTVFWFGLDTVTAKRPEDHHLGSWQHRYFFKDREEAVRQRQRAIDAVDAWLNR